MTTARFPASWRVNAFCNKTAKITPPEARPWYRFANLATDRTALHINDEVGGWGLTSSDFNRELERVTTPNLDVYVNSPGGDVGDGISIYEALRRHPAHVTTTADGYAFSIASVIMQAGDVRRMGKASLMMTHRAWGVSVGNRSDHLAAVEMLDKFDQALAGIYARRSGVGTPASWLETMVGPEGSDGTWFSADEAVDAGLADEVVEGTATDEAAAANVAYLDALLAARPATRAPDTAFIDAMLADHGRREAAELLRRAGVTL